jgi:2-C-methyl-D-erythritol 4-phosphate cytidylyltransferase / 2-C-methyl-D-erythritol 2,4-cyclodiphosphate synthase
MTYTAAIIAAGGQGTRLGADRPKQFLEVGGRSMLELSVGALVRSPDIQEVIVALPAAEAEAPPAFLTAAGHGTPVRIVAGGPRRQDSVANAFAAVDRRAELIVIHDAARPFVTEALLRRTLAAAAAHGAAIAALPVRDTVKQGAPADGSGARVVTATLPRETIFLAQTPQAFRRDVLARAIEIGRGAGEATDEAMLAERAGFAVHLVEGDPGNVKVTTREDLAEARRRMEHGALSVRGGPGAGLRIGHGYDLHRLVEGRPLILAGVAIPSARGLDGHSDADIVCHAVTDAVLGAAALGDVGRLYPDSDPRWRGADSITLLEGAMIRVREAGFAVGNVDVTVVAERPKLVPHLEAMRARLADALGCPASAVSVKGKTNEGMDSMGREDSMACHAVALLVPAD